MVIRDRINRFGLSGPTITVYFSYNAKITHVIIEMRLVFRFITLHTTFKPVIVTYHTYSDDQIVSNYLNVITQTQRV